MSVNAIPPPPPPPEALIHNPLLYVKTCPLTGVVILMLLILLILTVPVQAVV